MRVRMLVLVGAVLGLLVPGAAMAASGANSRSEATMPSTSSAAASVAGAAPAAATTAPSNALTTLPNSVFRGIDTLTPTGSIADDELLRVGVSLAGRDPAGATRAVHELYDPASPNFHHFFSPQQWDAAFGPDAATRAAVVSWLQDTGLNVLQSDGSYVYATGTAAQIQSRFGVRIDQFDVNGKQFYANVNAATVPAGVTSVLGLSNYKQARTFHDMTDAQPNAFPVSAETTPADLWSIYDMLDVNKGDNEGLAIFGWSMNGTTIESDLRQFEANNHLPAVPFSIQHFGGVGTHDNSTDGDVEWALDSQASTGMAPYASSLTAYDGFSPTDVDLLAPITSWINDAAGSKQGSASYGECEEDPVFSAAGAPASPVSGTEDAWNPVLQKGAAEGRSLFVSSGDSGYGCDPVAPTVNGVTLGPVPYQSWPAVSPWVVAVGGTVLTTDDGNPPKRDVEYAWTHGGGGASPFVAQPDYQSSAGVPLPTRGIPDVAAQSGDLLSGYDIVAGGTEEAVGGTSLSAPLMQGIWARVNAAAGSDAGYANPSLYANPSAFYDVVLGTNGLNVAAPGWDYTTGLGVPDVKQLTKAIAGQLTAVNPSTNTTPQGSFTQPACASGDLPLNDPAGDATGLVISGTPRPSVDDLDIRSATAAVNGTDLVVTMKVKKLSSTPPPGSNGDAFDVGFSYEGQSFWVEGSRLLTAESADFGSGSDSRGTSFGASDVKAAFDLKASTVSVTVPIATFNKHTAPGTTPLAAGSTLSSFSAITWQTEGALNGGVDQGAGTCSITL